MSVDSLKRSVDQEFGRLGEGAADLIGEGASQARNALDGASRAAGEAYGRANETARGALKGAANAARSVGGELEDFLGERPALAAAVALGIGIVLGALLLGGGKAIYDRR
jgi:ElaB/YqjD/DUF883 family membrane-anchored ribosome-binding protein